MFPLAAFFISASMSVYFYKNPGESLDRIFGTPKYSVDSTKIKSLIMLNPLKTMYIGFGSVGLLLTIITGNYSFVFLALALPYPIKRTMEKRTREAYQLEMKRNLRNAIQLLWVPVESGMPFFQAVKKIHQEKANPVVKELNSCYNEIRSGKEKRKAYRDLVERTVPEMEHVIRAVSKSEEMGTSIAEQLQNQLKAIQDEKKANANKISDKINRRAMFAAIIFMVPPFILLTFGPMVYQIVQTITVDMPW